MRRLLISIAVLAALAASAGAIAVSSASAVIPDLTGRSYVALGDSYAAGWGLPLAATQPAAGCDQSNENYPHVLANQFGFDLNDRSCSGAVISNVVSAPQGVSGGTAPVQTSALSAATDLVTLTVGGNDLGISQIAQMCVALTASGPVLGSLDGQSHATCREQFVVDTPGGPVNTLVTKIDTTIGPALAAALADIRARAPKARVIVVGYPAVAPDVAHTPAQGCYRGIGSIFAPRKNAYPYKDVDVQLLNDTQKHLDQVMASVTAASGATFISLLDDSYAHSPCTASDSYVDGITITFGSDALPVPGLPFGGYKKGALHPNAAGVAFMSAKVADAIRTLFASPTPTATLSPTPTSTPTVLPTEEPTPTPEPLPIITALGVVDGPNGLSLSWTTNGIGTFTAFSVTVTDTTTGRSYPVTVSGSRSSTVFTNRVSGHAYTVSISGSARMPSGASVTAATVTASVP